MFHVCPSPCLQVGMGAHITFLSRQIYREDITPGVPTETCRVKTIFTVGTSSMNSSNPGLTVVIHGTSWTEPVPNWYHVYTTVHTRITVHS